MKAPSVIARPLPEARAILEAAGAKVAAVAETRSPRGAPEGPLRVVRQRVTPEGVELVTTASVPLVRREK
jgi:hypothetical protein